MRSDEWMQQLATENNLAETSFIEPVLDADLPANVALYRIRW
jgi:predicted PhzF superfamily epimerase YddE/YHI9